MSSSSDRSRSDGTVSVETARTYVAGLTSRIRELEEAISGNKRQIAACTRHGNLAHCQLWYLLAAQSFRQTVSKVFDWRWPFVLIGAIATGGVLYIATQSWTVALTVAALSAGALACLLYMPSDPDAIVIIQRVQQRIAELTLLRNESRDRLSHSTTELATQTAALNQWSDYVRQAEYKESQQYRRQQLLRRDWKALRSVPFENFLEEVFKELGYVVETTKITGDQGADLIVSKAGHRIAIQVKGYFSSVSNSAVQEAYTAKAFYGCEACAVITNSRFTASAKDVAGRVGCVLMDEDTLPSLIKGDVDLWQQHLLVPVQAKLVSDPMSQKN